MKPNVYRLDAGARVVVTPEGETAAWNQLMPLGRWFRADFPKGGIEVTASMLSTIVANWERAGRPELPVDYNHVEDGPASGWIRQLEVRDSGLWGLITWTDKARAAIKADELRYLSPTFSLQSMDRRTGQPQGPWLYGAGLLNDPFFDSMPRVAAASNPSATQEPHHMNKKMICDALGMPETSTDEEVMASIAALMQQKKSDKNHNITTSLGDVEKLRAAHTALEATVRAAREGEAAAKAELEKLKAESAEKTLKAGIDKLVSEGRIVAADGDKVRKYAAAVGAEEAVAFFASLPARGPSKGEAGVPGKEMKAEEMAEERRVLLDKLQAEGKSVDEAFRLARKQRPELFPAPVVHRVTPTAS